MDLVYNGFVINKADLAEVESFYQALTQPPTGGDQAATYFSIFCAPGGFYRPGLFVARKAPKRRLIMAIIQLTKGVDLDHLPPTVTVHWISKDTIVQRLAVMRAEWEELAALEGKPLDDMVASVGLILADFARIIGNEG